MSCLALIGTDHLLQALKGTSTPEKYKLYWSSRPEFVRAAAKFSATIIPFGAIGAEEQVKSVMGSATLAQACHPTRYMLQTLTVHPPCLHGQLSMHAASLRALLLLQPFRQALSDLTHGVVHSVQLLW